MRHTWREWSLITAAVKRWGHFSLGYRSLSRACTLVSSWVQEGSVEGYHAARAAGPAARTRTTPAIRLTGQDAGPERGASTAARLHPLPGPFLLDHCPSFTNPAAWRGHQIPCLFWTLFPFGHFILLFMLNKSLSEAWRHVHCVCRLLFPPQNMVANIYVQECVEHKTRQS